MQKAAKAYFQTQVSTTSQGELLLMLYDGAVKFLHQAKDKIDEKDYAQKGILISKALDVIAELDGSLNAQKGGEIAQNLHNLYFYCNTRLLLANMNMDTALIDEVIKILGGLRSAYAEVIEAQSSMSGQATQTGQTNTAGAAKASSGPRPPLLLNKNGSAEPTDAPEEKPSTQTPPSAQEGRPESPLESLGTHIARTPSPHTKEAVPPPAAESAAPQHKADEASGQPAASLAASPESPTAKQDGNGAAANDHAASADARPEAEKPAAPTPNRGRLLAGASIYKKMASQSS